MNKKIAFLTTIFPMERKYLLDFLNSLQNQTFKNFDLIIVNDGYDDLAELLVSYKNIKTIVLAYNGTPAKNREFGINYCLEQKYDILIFGDSDDYFENNRVEKSIEFLKDNDIVVNDLSLFDESEIYEDKYISNRVKNRSKIDLEFIKNKNVFGLSNTALKLKDIDKIELPSDLVAVDWYFFTLLLLKNKVAIFTNETVTYYRQHAENLVGLKKLDIQSYKRGIKVKKKHFQCLNHITDIFNEELNRISEIELKVDNIKLNTETNDNPLWWELI